MVSRTNKLNQMRAYVGKIINQHCDGGTWFFNGFGISLIWVAFTFILCEISGLRGSIDTIFAPTFFLFLPLFFINDWRRANSILDDNRKGFIVITIITSFGILDMYNDIAFFPIMRTIMSIWILFANSKRK